MRFILPHTFRSGPKVLFLVRLASLRPKEPLPAQEKKGTYDETRVG